MPLAPDIGHAIAQLSGLDHALFFLLVLVSPLVDRYWLYPALCRATAANVFGARARFYAVGILIQWCFSAAVIAIWLNQARPLADIGIAVGSGWRLAIGLAVACAFAWNLWSARQKILARPELAQKIRQKFACAEALLPHSSSERSGFRLLSLTAGTCEELLYRGFVMWYLSLWTGWIAAVPIVAGLFGFAHWYLGNADVIRTAKIGLFFSVVVLAAGSLWPAMIIHATMDLVAGDVGYFALNGPRSNTSNSAPSPVPSTTTSATDSITAASPADNA